MQRGSNGLRIRWYGHACFEIDGSVSVVTDPHDGKSIGLPPPKAKADLVLISHDHFDHNCARIVQTSDTKVLTDSVMTVEKGVRVEGIKAAHDDQNGSKRGMISMFRFEMDGISFAHLGDVGQELDDIMVEQLSEVDVLFVPVGDVFTIGPQAAKRLVEAVRPKVAVPMHYRLPGLSLSIRPVQDFLDLFEKEQTVRLGNEIEFSKDDLPEKGTEIWVFSM